MSAETVIAFPSGVMLPASVAWRLTRPGDEFIGNPFTGGGVADEKFGLWRATLQLPDLEEAEEALVLSWASRLSAAGAVCWVPVFVRSAILGSLGALASTEQIAGGPAFAAGVADWTASGSTLTANGGRMKILNTGAAKGRARQSIAIASAVPFAVQALFGQGSVDDYSVQVGTSAGGTDLINGGAVSGDGYLYTSAAFTAANPTHVQLSCESTTAGDYVLVERVSLRRCGLVKGGSQTGKKVLTDGWPTSTNGVLLTGDFCQIAGRLHRLTQDLDTNSSGEGYLFLAPGPYVAPADNDPVIVGDPLVRMRVMQNEAGADFRPPLVGTYAVDLIESPA